MKRLIKRIAVLLIVMMMVLSAASPALAAGFDSARNNVARIYAVFGIVKLNGEVMATEGGTGTCFAVAESRNSPVQYFVTNRHVISGEGCEPVVVDYGDGLKVQHEPELLQAYIIFDNYENKIPITVECVDDECDLAVVRTHEATTARKPAVIRGLKADDAKSMDVFAVGFPGETEDFLYFYDNPSNFEDQFYSNPNDATVSDGMISRVADGAETGKGETYVITADINHGNSGGPLVDKKGNVVGVNTWGTEKFNYAISANEVMEMLDDNKIPYVKHDPLRTVLICAAVALVVIAVAAVIVVLVMKNRPVHGRALYGIKGSLEGQKFVLKRKMYIGRDSGKCAIAFPNSTAGVSKVHCCIGYNGKEVVVMDMNSKYGTWIDDHQLAPKTPTRLHRGHTLYIGSQGEGLMLRNE